jgi:hypothetical protein
MRSAIKFTVAFMALIGLVAGNAMALEVNADASATFGQTTHADTEVVDGDDTYVAKSWSQLEAHGESNVNVSGGEGPITAKARLRIRDYSSAAALRHEVKWMATDQLGITISGSGFGVSATAPKTGVAQYRNPVGDMAATLDTGYSVPTFQVNFAVQEGMNVGVAILPTNDSSGWTQGLQTMIPYFEGSFGEIELSAYSASASGKYADGANAEGELEYGGTVKASNTGFALSYALGDGMSVAFDYATGAETETVNVAGEDVEIESKDANMALSFKGMGVGVQYVSFAPTVEGEDAGKITNINAVYAIPAGNGSYGFGLRQVTYGVPEGSDADATSEQAIFLGVKTAL